MIYCRDVELAKFEAFLKKENAQEISALVRGNQHLAYPIKGCDYTQHAFMSFFHARKHQSHEAARDV